MLWAAEDAHLDCVTTDGDAAALDTCPPTGGAPVPLPLARR